MDQQHMSSPLDQACQYSQEKDVVVIACHCDHVILSIFSVRNRAMERRVDVILLETNGRYEQRLLSTADFAHRLGCRFMDSLPNKKPDVAAYVDEDAREKRLANNAWADFLQQRGFLFKLPLKGRVILCGRKKCGNDESVTNELLLSVRHYFTTHFERSLEQEETSEESDSSSSLEER
jgi:hypothetical protein